MFSSIFTVKYAKIIACFSNEPNVLDSASPIHHSLTVYFSYFDYYYYYRGYYSYYYCGCYSYFFLYYRSYDF